MTEGPVTEGPVTEGPVTEGPVTVAEVRGLSVTYGRRPALAGVDLDLAAGRVTALVGPSGCGKTTFLQVLNRLTDLVPGCRVEGTVRVLGREVVGPGAGALDLREHRRRVGMIFQRPEPFDLSIRANLHLPLREGGVRRRDRDAVVERVLAEVGLAEEVADRLDERATDLSGGQRQRLCIARALTLEPRVLLMDEPCSALDPVATERIERLIRDLVERPDPVTIVIVTHHLAQARRVADDMVVFWLRGGAGRPIEAGPTGRVFESPQDPDAAAYLQGRRG